MEFNLFSAPGLSLMCYLAVVSLGCSFLLVRFRRRAGDLRIRARSPDLATFPAVYAIIVGGVLIPLQELLQMSGVGYPCVLTLVQSWMFLPVWGAPFALRSLRVLIASDKGRQEKFGFFLRKRTTLAMEAFLCTVGLCIVVTLSQVLKPYSRGAGATGLGAGGGGECYMLMEWQFLLPFCALQMVIFGVLGFRLRHVNDLLNISNELRVNFMLYLLFGCPYYLLQLHYRYRTDGPVPTSLQFLISAMVVFATINTMWASVGGLEDMFDAVGWDSRSAGFAVSGSSDADSTLGPSSHGAGGSSVSAASVIGAPRVADAVTRSDVKRWKQHYNNVPSIMRNASMSAAFGALANRFLCSESYRFLVAVNEFRAFTSVAGPGLQHLLFKDICKEYVVVNSEQEINISHDQRDQVLQYVSYRRFSPLNESQRADVFRDAEREVANMLKLNLLSTFHNSAVFLETCAAVDVEAHVWDLEEKKLLMGSDASDDDQDAAKIEDEATAEAAASARLGSQAGTALEGLRDTSGGEDTASWRLSGSDTTASWRGSSGRTLLSHLGLSSTSVGPSL